MTRITFVESDGNLREVEATPGHSLMEVAREAHIRGIIAECGGACACSTCHVYVDDAWIDRVGLPNSYETDMLEFAVEPDPSRSRLSCQIRVSDSIDGLIVRIPAAQA